MLTANGASGTTHDFFCYDDTGQVWNGSAFVAWVDANYATYRVTATERGTSGTFTGADPDGTQSYEMRVRSGTLAGSYVVWAEQILVAAIKADAALGTSDGGLVAEVNKIPRAAAAVTAGAAQQKHLENSLGATLQTVYEVLDGDVA